MTSFTKKHCLFKMLLLVVFVFFCVHTGNSIFIYADGSISVGAVKLELIVNEITNGTISVTLPDKPEDTEEIRYLGNVTALSVSVSGTYTPPVTEYNPNPTGFNESGVSDLANTSFKFKGNKSGTWNEKFTVGFSPLATESYNSETNSWEAGVPYSLGNAETEITFTVKNCDKKCSGGIVAIVPLGYNLDVDLDMIKVAFNSSLHHCTSGSHSCHKVNFSNVKTNEAGKYEIRCKFDSATSTNHGCSPANCELLGSIWVVRIKEMQYKVGSMAWENVGSGIKVPVGSVVSFRVLPNPTTVPFSPWTATYPQWTNPDGSTGIGDYTSFTFNTLSTPGGTQYEVKFTCGTSTAKVDVKVVGVNKLLYYSTSGYVDFPNEGTTTAPNYCLYTDKSYLRLFVEASNTMGNHYWWPEKPEPKPVWGGGAANYGTPQEPQYRARVSYEGYDSGDTINLSAECGNTVHGKVVLVGIDRIEYRFGGDPDIKYTAVPDPLVVLQDSKVRFKAIKKPARAKWPVGKPIWSGTSGASGASETTDVTLGTISSSVTDYKTVIATCGDVEVKNIVTVKAELDKVSFSNDHTIVRDSGSLIYSAPHWVKGRSLNLDYPIGYTSGKEIKVKAEFKCNPDIALSSGVFLAAQGKRTISGGKYPAQAGAATISGSTITANLSCGNTDSLKVDYITLGLEWQIKSTNAQFDWKTGGYSTNRLYVTLKEPTGPKIETLYELACKNKGATNDLTCIANTWTSFKNRDVKAWDVSNSFTRPLYYYNTYNANGVTSAESMLINPASQGQCHAWADMFRKTLAINGVAGNTVLVDPPTGYDVFGVKNIDFSGTSPYNRADLDTTKAGIPGQNMATPQAKLFARHFIVKAGGSYYDPSYGVTTTSEADYSNKSVDALYDGTYWYKRPDITPAPNLRFTVLP